MAQELVPQDTKFGPAMTALKPQHRLFVMAMFDLGTMNATEAARAAGYHDNGKTGIRVTAFHLAHREDIKVAMQEEARRRLTMALPVATQALVEMAENPQHKDRAKAVGMILNRAGVPESVDRNVNINVTMTIAEKLQKARGLAEQLGIPLEQIMGNVTDAEFEEVVDDEFANEQY